MQPSSDSKAIDTGAALPLPVTPLDGERLTKETAHYAQALAVLERQRLPMRMWHVWATLGVGALIGILWAPVDASFQQALSSVVTGISYFIGLVAILECVRLNRKCDALLVLVKHFQRVQGKS